MTQGKTPFFVMIIVIYLIINHSHLDSNFGRPLKCSAMQPVTASVLISRPSDTIGRWLIHPLMKVLLVSFHGNSKNSKLLSKGIQQENSLKCNRRRTTKSVILWISLCQIPLLHSSVISPIHFHLLLWGTKTEVYQDEGSKTVKVVSPFQQVWFSFFPKILFLSDHILMTLLVSHEKTIQGIPSVLIAYADSATKGRWAYLFLFYLCFSYHVIYSLPALTSNNCLEYHHPDYAVFTLILLSPWNDQGSHFPICQSSFENPVM